MSINLYVGVNVDMGKFVGELSYDGDKDLESHYSINDIQRHERTFSQVCIYVTSSRVLPDIFALLKWSKSVPSF